MISERINSTNRENHLTTAAKSPINIRFFRRLGTKRLIPAHSFFLEVLQRLLLTVAYCSSFCEPPSLKSDEGGQGSSARPMRSKRHPPFGPEPRCQRSLCVGIVRYDPLYPVALAELMARADQNMFKLNFKRIRLEGSSGAFCVCPGLIRGASCFLAFHFQFIDNLFDVGHTCGEFFHTGPLRFRMDFTSQSHYAVFNVVLHVFV